MNESSKQDLQMTSKYAPALAALLPVALLLPFINKAFHIDDTVYIMVAQQIAQSPFDYFGFQMNWVGWTESVYKFNKNPPGLSYFLAPWGLIFGWSEISMHSAMLIPTALSSLGIFRLAERLCARPLLATTIAVCTPGFLVSSSNVMCEPLMLACYVWAIVWWTRGLESGRKRELLAGMLLVGFGTLVKFVVLTALPLLLAYTLWKQRRLTTALLWFLVPVCIVASYELVTLMLYNKSFLRDIAEFSSFHRAQSWRLPAGRAFLVTLAFVGGLFLPVPIIALCSEKPRVLLGVLIGMVVYLGLIFSIGGLDDSYLMYSGGSILWGLVAQQAIFTTMGAYIMYLGALRFAKEPRAEPLLLLLLIGGIFAFGGYVNWTLNARSLLPMVPAVAILTVQRLETIEKARFGKIAERAAIAIAVIVSLTVCIGDYEYAGSARAFANKIQDELDTDERNVLYGGHLGFQWYMNAASYEPIEFMPVSDEQQDVESDIFDFPNGALRMTESGDAVIIWQNERKLPPIPEERVSRVDTHTFPRKINVSTHDRVGLTGFYGNVGALLPYRFYEPPPQEFRIHYIE